MNTPRTRAEFERNFNLLHRQIEDGKFKVAQGLSHAIEGIARVRYLPNGRIDFLSVDESARLEANMMAHCSDERFLEELKDQQSTLENQSNPGDTESPPPPDNEVT